MPSSLNRRDFLKLAGLLSAGAAAPRFFYKNGPALQSAGQANVLVVVFDAWSAFNISLYGYQRNTTPNIDRLAERATVFHNHFAPGNFTTPGTASLLTGTLPFTHRAVGIHQLVIDAYADKNIFNAFAGYHRVAYSHNPVANTLLNQFFRDIDDYVPREALFLKNNPITNQFFGADEDAAVVAWNRALDSTEDGYTYSLYLNYWAARYEAEKQAELAQLRRAFPRGIPVVQATDPFTLEDGIDWLAETVQAVPQPFFTYCHYMPPHKPYRTRGNFAGTYTADDFRPLEKEKYLFYQGPQGKSNEELAAERVLYDEYIRYVDFEFNRLFETLQRSGVLDNTWLILTSDHGELFERGVTGHSTPYLYQPVMHVPLLIFGPGQESRRDVIEQTSAIDLLPTLLHLTGHPVPAWTEGRIIPPYRDRGAPEEPRDIFSLNARKTELGRPIIQNTTTVIRGPHKFIHTAGYTGMEADFEELYDLAADPDEMENIAADRPEITAALKQAVLDKLAAANAPYL